MRLKHFMIEFGRTRLLQTCGLVPIPGVGLPIIEWVRKHDVQAWKATRKILTTKDYVTFPSHGAHCHRYLHAIAQHALRLKDKAMVRLDLR